jgi:hypothetical protein
MKKTINKEFTLTGALGADYSSSTTVDIPADVRVTGVRFTEIANSTGVNYDLTLKDKTGIVMDDSHRLDLVSVINGSTFRNAPFCDMIHPFRMEGNQKVNVQYRLIDALGGGATIKLRVTFFCEYI